MSLTNNQKQTLDILRKHIGDATTVTRATLVEVSEKEWGTPNKFAWITNNPDNVVERGVFHVPDSLKKTAKAVNKKAKKTPRQKRPSPVAQEKQQVRETVRSEMSVSSLSNTVADFHVKKDPLYVPFGNHEKLTKIIGSAQFFPVFITGLSGNGKTTMVEQVCAELNRECVRVNITKQTDEDDLLGGFRLVDGKTVFQYGPVIEAMERGAVLLLDEVDLAEAAIMCLQSVLEGKGVYLKKINEYIAPKAGFTVVATANTKGKGDESGNFSFTNVLNEAFLDRFAATLFQPYPSSKLEQIVLRKVAQSYGLDTKNPVLSDFIKNLTDWGDASRVAFTNGSIDAVITTRRLVNAITAFAMFDSKKDAIDLILERFDEENRESLADMFSKLDPKQNQGMADGERILKEREEEAKRKEEALKKARSNGAAAKKQRSNVSTSTDPWF